MGGIQHSYLHWQQWSLGFRKSIGTKFGLSGVRNVLSPVFAYIGYRVSSRILGYHVSSRILGYRFSSRILGYRVSSRINTSREYYSEETFLIEKSMQNLCCTQNISPLLKIYISSTSQYPHSYYSSSSVQNLIECISRRPERRR